MTQATEQNLELLRECVRAKISYWNAIAELERVFGTERDDEGKLWFTDRQSDSALDAIGTIASMSDDRAESVTTDQLEYFIKEVSE